MRTCIQVGKIMAFSDNLKRLRRDKGLSQNELAEITGIKSTHISRMESNEDSDPKLSTIYKLMSALGCSSEALLMDGGKIGTDGVLKISIDRVLSLPDESKRVLIDVIDKYCIAMGMQKILEDQKGWFKFNTFTGKNKEMIDELKP
jgi:transcriptional regulator with XRE-family HTH domain